MPPTEPNINEILRDLITKANTTGACLTYRQIALLARVDYDRLWRFQRRRSDTLPISDAGNLYKALTGKDLFHV